MRMDGSEGCRSWEPSIPGALDGSTSSVCAKTLETEAFQADSPPALGFLRRQDRKALPGSAQAALAPFAVHVVFDRDEHRYFRDSIRRARDLGLSLGVSVPCFELWALLLHQDQTAALSGRQVQEKLKEAHPGYCHDRHPYLCLDSVLAGRAVAGERARWLASRAGDTGDEFANPTTTFDLVLTEIFGCP